MRSGCHPLNSPTTMFKSMCHSGKSTTFLGRPGTESLRDTQLSSSSTVEKLKKKGIRPGFLKQYVAPLYSPQNKSKLTKFDFEITDNTAILSFDACSKEDFVNLVDIAVKDRITPNGNFRSDAEIEGISQARLRKRMEKKKILETERRARSKERSRNLRSRYPSYFSSLSPISVEEKIVSHHARRSRSVQKAREDARLVREFQKRSKSTLHSQSGHYCIAHQTMHDTLDSCIYVCPKCYSATVNDMVSRHMHMQTCKGTPDDNKAPYCVNCLTQECKQDCTVLTCPSCQGLYFSSTNHYCDFGEIQTLKSVHSTITDRSSLKSKKVVDRIGMDLKKLRAFIEKVYSQIKPKIENATGVVECILTNKYVDTTFNVVSYVYALLTSPDPIHTLAITKLFCSTLDLSGVATFSIPGFAALLHTIGMKLYNNKDKASDAEVFVSQSATPFSDELSFLSKNFHDVISAPTINAVVQILVCVAALERLPYTVAMNVYKVFGAPSVKDRSFIGLFSVLSESIICVIRAIELIIGGASLSEALFHESPITSTLREAEYLISMKDRVYSGLQIVDHIDRVEFMRRLDVCAHNMTVLSKQMNSRQRASTRFDQILISLTEVRINIIKTTSTSLRRVPLGFVIHGAPGIGKSHILKFMCKMHCDVVKRTYSPSLMYQKNREEFFTGYQPLSMPYIQYPEVGSTHTNIASKVGDPLAEQLLSLIDCNPFNCPMADVKDKGNTYAIPEMVLIDTNIPDMNFKHIFNNPSAYYRRFVFVEVVVKEEFRDVNGYAIDRSKCAASETRFLDKYIFTVKSRIPSDAKAILYQETDLFSGEIDGFADWTRQFMVDHIARESKNLDYQVCLEGYGDKAIPTVNVDNPSKRFVDCEVPNVPSRQEVQAALPHPLAGDKRCLDKNVAPTEKIPAYVKGIKNFSKNIVDYAHSKVFKSKIDSDSEFDEFDNDLESGSYGNITEFSVDSTAKRAYSIAKLNGQARNECGPDCGHSVYDMDCTHSPDFSRNSRYADISNAQGRRPALKRSLSADLKASKQKKPSSSIHSDRPIKVSKFDEDERIYRASLIREAERDISRRVASRPTIVKIEEQKKPLPEIVPLPNNIRIADNGIVTVQHQGDVPTFAELWTAVQTQTVRFQFARMFAWISMNYTIDRSFISWIAFSLFLLLLLFAYTRIAVLLLGLHLFFYNYSKALVRGATQMVVETFQDRGRAIRNFNNFRGAGQVPWSSVFVAGFGSVTLIMSMLALLKPAQKDVKHIYVHDSQSSEFKEKNIESENLKQQEEVTGCAPPSARIPNKITPDSWNVVTNVNPCVYTGSLESLYELISRNCVRISIKSSVKTSKTSGFFVCSNILLLNRHSFYFNGKSAIISISPTGDYSNDTSTHDTEVSESDLVKVSGDMVIVQVSKYNMKDLRVHFTQNESFLNVYEAMAYGQLNVATKNIMPNGEFVPVCDKNPCYDGTIPLEKSSSFAFVTNEARVGNCGNPIVAKMDKNGSAILGFHYGGNSTTAVFMTVNQKQLQSAIDILLKKHPMMPLTSHSFLGLPVLDHTPVPKSMTRYEILHTIQYIGRDPSKTLSKSKSHVIPTKLNAKGEIDLMLFHSFDFVVTEKYCAPLLAETRRDGKYLNPWNINLVKIAGPKKSVSVHSVSRAVDAYFSHIIKHLGEKKLNPMNIENAIMGHPDDGYLKSMDGSKSAGYGRKGPKRDFMIYTQDPYYVEPNQQLKKDIIEYIDVLLKGENPGVIFQGALKDEARSIDKVSKGKTRMFCISPVVYLTVARAYLAPLYTLIMEDNEAFCAAAGVDMHREGVKIFEDMVSFSNNIGEGDFSNFDQSIPFEIGWGVTTLLYKLAERFGYNAEALRVVRGLLTDSLFPTIVVNGDVFRCPGYQPSGFFDTFSNNCMRNILMQLTFWEMRIGDPTEFFKYVHVRVAGDDVLFSVKDSHKDKFNAVTFGNFCGEVLGLPFTSSSKDDNVVEFVTKETMSFLKRNLRYHPLLKRNVAALDLNSIAKTLTHSQASGNIPFLTQITQAVSMTLVEIYLHCDTVDQYNVCRNKLIELIHGIYKVPVDKLEKEFKKAKTIKASLNRDIVEEDEVDMEYYEAFYSQSDVGTLEDAFQYMIEDLSIILKSQGKSPSSWPVYLCDFYAKMQLHDELQHLCPEGISFLIPCRSVDGGRQNSKDSFMLRTKIEQDLQYRVLIRDSGTARLWKNIKTFVYFRFKMVLSHQEARGFGRLCVNFQWPAKSLSYEIDLAISGLNKELASLVNPVPEWDVSSVCLISDPRYGRDAYFTNKANKYRAYQDRRESIISTLKIYRTYYHTLSYTSQSDLYSQSAVDTNSTDPIATTNKVSDTVTDIAGLDVKMEEGSGNYDIGGLPTRSYNNLEFMMRPVNVSTQTWYLNDPLKYTIDPINLFLYDPAVRSKIRNIYIIKKFKVHIRLNLSGMPFHQGRAIAAVIPYSKCLDVAQRYITASGVSGDELMWYSQMETCGYLDVNDNEPLELVYDVIFPQPALSFGGTSTVLPSSSDFPYFANLCEVVVASFGLLEAVSTDAGDASVSTWVWFSDIEFSTDTATKMDLSSQSNNEEVSGPVETVMNAAASIAGQLEKIPSISAPAGVGRTVFSGLGKLAAIYGLSRPNLHATPIRTKNEPFQNGANMSGAETGHKLSADPNHAVNVTPLMDKSGQDHMSFEYIARRNSYVKRINWAVGDAPLIPVSTIPICPRMIQQVAHGTMTGFNYQETPMGWLMNYFAFWRVEKMIVTIDIIKSKFHRGKFGILFEPNAQQSALIISSGIKLNVENILVVDLQETTHLELEIYWAQPYAYLRCPTRAQATLMSAVTDYSPYYQYMNGFLMVFPITSLQCPMNKSIHMNVSVRVEGVQLQGLNSTNITTGMKWYGYTPPFEEEKFISQSDVQITHDMNPKSSMPSELNTIFFGEKIVGFRSILKRWTTYSLITPDFTAIASPYFLTTQTIIPKPLVNIDDTSFDTGSAADGVKQPTRHFMSQLNNAFLGMRGSHKYRFYFTGKNFKIGDTVFVRLSIPETTNPGNSYGYGVGTFGGDVTGTTYFVPSTNAGIEVQFPYYVNMPWLPATPTTATGYNRYSNAQIASRDTLAFKRFSLVVQYSTGDDPTSMRIKMDHAVGDDFSYEHFLAAPPSWGA